MLFGAMLIMPVFNRWWENREAKKQVVAPSFTLEDVKQLIATAIAEAQLSGRPQV